MQFPRRVVGIMSLLLVGSCLTAGGAQAQLKASAKQTKTMPRTGGSSGDISQPATVGDTSSINKGAFVYGLGSNGVNTADGIPGLPAKITAVGIQFDIRKDLDYKDSLSSLVLSSGLVFNDDGYYQAFNGQFTDLFLSFGKNLLADAGAGAWNNGVEIILNLSEADSNTVLQMLTESYDPETQTARLYAHLGGGVDPGEDEENPRSGGDSRWTMQDGEREAILTLYTEAAPDPRVPEPGALALLAAFSLGAGGLLVRRR